MTENQYYSWRSRMDRLHKKATQGITKKQAKNLGKVQQPMARRSNIEKRKVVRNRPMTVTGVINGPTTSKELPTPDWFRTTQQVDVSIIIPLYKSQNWLPRQVASWGFEEDGLTKEIIYVDDQCPNRTYSLIDDEWAKRSPTQPIGKIIVNDFNAGFSGACNMGAKYATGKYLIFLNADTEVTPYWVKPMIDLFEDKTVGMVGNMQLKNGRIDSAGSEWSWKHKSFQHIGRNVYKGVEVKDSMKLSEAPNDLLQVAEREMVTGCCITMPAALYHDLGGFDTNYKVGYWEDSELCMQVKDAGYKIMFQPSSKILHGVSHSQMGGHPSVQKNRDFFFKRWVDTGRIDKHIGKPRDILPRTLKQNCIGKVVGCVIACNEEEFLEASVTSVAPLVDEWIFVIGGNQYAFKSGMCDAKGYPTDDTLAIAKRLAKKFNGKVIEPPKRPWADKVEMRNAYANLLQPGNWMFMLDGDEVYKERQLWRVTELMQDFEVLNFQYWVFWNDVNTIGAGSWMNYPQERVVRWKKGYGYRGSNHLFVSTTTGGLARDEFPTFNGKEKMFYHYSWVRPLAKIRQKLEYYQHQTGRAQPNSYVEDVYLQWRKDPQSVQGKTHPIGGGETLPFPGIHPKPVQDLINQGVLAF